MSRYLPDGMTFDQFQSVKFTMLQMFMSAWFPRFYNWVIDKVTLMISTKVFPDVPKSWNFSPAPSFSVTPPLIADELYPLMKSGFAEPVPAVRRVLGPKTVELTDGRILEDIDSIIYCTGYDICVPFLAQEYNPYEVVGDTPKLFHGTFSLHPDIEVRDSIAFIGHGAAHFPGFVLHELNAMAISQTWLGNSPLPSYEKMLQWHKNWIKWINDLLARQKMVSTFYVLFIPLADHLQWLNTQAGTELFEHFSWTSWKSWQFWWNEPKLYKKCKGVLMSPSLWRLFETGKRKSWAKARDQIWYDNQFAEKRLVERNEKKKGINAKAMEIDSSFSTV
jgi:dimethylaniline monooxygenase (N-oxide forming)